MGNLKSFIADHLNTFTTTACSRRLSCRHLNRLHEPHRCKLGARPCSRSNGAFWYGCGRLPRTAVGCAGCCTSLLYGDDRREQEHRQGMVDIIWPVRDPSPRIMTPVRVGTGRYLLRTSALLHLAVVDEPQPLVMRSCGLALKRL